MPGGFEASIPVLAVLADCVPRRDLPMAQALVHPGEQTAEQLVAFRCFAAPEHSEDLGLPFIGSSHYHEVH